MGKDMFWTGVTFSVIFTMLALAFWPANNGNVVVVQYDCTVLKADTPQAVIEECQKRNPK